MRKTYIANAWVKVTADSDEEAVKKFEALFPDFCMDLSDGVELLVADGAWDEVDEVDDGPECICPPDLIARGGFKGGCPVHA